MNFRLRLSPRMIVLLSASYAYLLGALAFALLIIGFLVFVQPRWDAVRQTSVAEIRANEAKLEERRQYLDRLHALEAQYRSLQADQAGNLAKLKEVLPSEEDIPKLIVQLDALATTSQLSLDSISITKQLPAAAAANPAGGTPIPEQQTAVPLQKLQVTLTLSAGTTYTQFKSYLASLEDHVRLFDVLQLQYAPQAGTAAEGQGDRYGVTFETYYRG